MKKLNSKNTKQTKNVSLRVYFNLFFVLLAECNADEFKCKTGSECIPKSQVCDNMAQCTDRSDEWQCVQLDGTQLLAKYVHDNYFIFSLLLLICFYISFLLLLCDCISFHYACCNIILVVFVGKMARPP